MVRTIRDQLAVRSAERLPSPPALPNALLAPAEQSPLLRAGSARASPVSQAGRLPQPRSTLLGNAPSSQPAVAFFLRGLGCSYAHCRLWSLGPRLVRQGSARHTRDRGFKDPRLANGFQLDDSRPEPLELRLPRSPLSGSPTGPGIIAEVHVSAFWLRVSFVCEKGNREPSFSLKPIADRMSPWLSKWRRIGKLRPKKAYLEKVGYPRVVPTKTIAMSPCLHTKPSSP